MSRLSTSAVVARSVFTRVAPALVLALTACGDNVAPPSPDAALAPNPTAAAVSGDFNVTGVFSTVDVVTRVARPNALAGVAGGDPYLRRVGDFLYIVNRDQGENVTVLGGSPPTLVDQYPTGGGSNPQDVAPVGDKLYVPALGTAGVVVINRATRTSSVLAFPGIDPDNEPDCVSAYAVGTRVYVACGLLDPTFTPRGPGKMVVIDTTRDVVETSFDLPAANPAGLIMSSAPATTYGGDLLVPTVPSFTDMRMGCLARVRTTGAPGANGCAVSNLELGGYVNHAEMSADGARLWLATALFSPDFSTQTGKLRALDVVRGELDPVVSAASQMIVDVATCPDGRVVASDITMDDSGLRIWKDGVEETTATIDIGRPVSPGNGLICW
jgi:hypothetical protein